MDKAKFRRLLYERVLRNDKQLCFAIAGGQIVLGVIIAILVGGGVVVATIIMAGIALGSVLAALLFFSLLRYLRRRYESENRRHD